MNVCDLLWRLQAAAHTEDLQQQIDELTAALVEARAHLTERQTTCKVIEESSTQPGRGIYQNRT